RPAGMAADYILTGGADRKQRGRAGSRIDLKNSPLQTAPCPVTTLNEYPARKRRLRRGRRRKTGADAAGGNRDALRNDHLTLHAASQSNDCTTSGSWRSEPECSRHCAACQDRGTTERQRGKTRWRLGTSKRSYR